MDAFGELQTIPPQSIIARSDEDLGDRGRHADDAHLRERPVA